jgi:protein-L-isoaspartate(D-aspartate) O-methyltransferase
MGSLRFVLFGLSLLAMIDDAAGADRYASQRQAMVAEIGAITRETHFETGRERLHERVLKAMTVVPRHRFVPAREETYAYDNRPLPIGHGQTISQPFIVALMTDLLEVKEGDRILEIGTGCGYQAAVLAELAREVYSIEIVEPLGKDAAARLAELGYRNVRTRIGDGYLGWPEEAPFDGIIVTAGAPSVPPTLIDQLKPGGRLVIPVGSQLTAQDLLVIEKRADGTISRRSVLPVRFVPLVPGKR